MSECTYPFRSRGRGGKKNQLGGLKETVKVPSMVYLSPARPWDMLRSAASSPCVTDTDPPPHMGTHGQINKLRGNKPQANTVHA